MVKLLIVVLHSNQSQLKLKIMKNILLAIAVIITIYLIGNDIDVQLANDGNQSPISLTK